MTYQITCKSIIVCNILHTFSNWKHPTLRITGQWNPHKRPVIWPAMRRSFPYRDVITVKVSQILNRLWDWRNAGKCIITRQIYDKGGKSFWGPMRFTLSVFIAAICALQYEKYLLTTLTNLDNHVVTMGIHVPRNTVFILKQGSGCFAVHKATEAKLPYGLITLCNYCYPFVTSSWLFASHHRLWHGYQSINRTPQMFRVWLTLLFWSMALVPVSLRLSI